jgi:hypothetical protein
VGVAVVLVASGVWVLDQRDAYDPSERDISMAVMEQSSVEDTLYKAPLQLWSDPSLTTASSGPNLGIFPASILEGDWTPTSRLQEFTEDTLYEKINGAAEQFLSFGFEKLHYVALSQPDNKLELGLELYDMGEAQNAQGIFGAQRGDDREVLHLAKAMYYPTGSGAVARIGKYYVKIAGNEARVQEKAEQLVAALESLGGAEAEKPLPIAVLERAGVPEAGMAFQKSDVFQFAFAEEFWFGAPEGAGDMKYYVHEASSDDAAKTLFDELLAAHTEWDYEPVEQDETHAVLKHKFLETYLTLHRRGALVFGVEYAPDAEVAKQADATLTEAIANAGQNAEEQA